MISHRTIALVFAVGCFSVATVQAGTWTPLAHQPTFLNPPSQCALYPNANCAPPGSFSSGGVSNANLLTDGSVLFEAIGVDDSGNATWLEYKLTPDAFGSYANGTWSQAASLPDAASATNLTGWGPIAFASAVLPDGRVIYEGGEYSGYSGFALTNRGAIYDPVHDSWTSVPPPPFDNLYPANPPMLPGFNQFYSYPRYPAPSTSQLVAAIGDSQSVVLPDGTFMLASKLSRQQALLDPKTLTWTLTGTNKADVNAEEGWTLLPNGKVLTVDCELDYWFGLAPSYMSPSNSELYDPKTGTWSSAGTTVNALTSFPEGEIGPAVLMPNGVVFATGDNGTTALYDSHHNKWSAGPPFPTISVNGQNLQLAPGDTAAALLPNGNVLVSATTTVNEFPPTKFFEFDGHRFIAEPDTPDAPMSFGSTMLVLPSGQILEFDGNTDIELYTPTRRDGDRRDDDRGDEDRPWYAPSRLDVPPVVSPGKTYTVRGVYLNGVSQGAMEGDDDQMATNYPLVRITNLATHHVFYSRTHGFSSMAVANDDPVTARFDVPSNQEKGLSLLEVVANGAASEPVRVIVKGEGE
jgi:hypothetical protein